MVNKSDKIKHYQQILNKGVCKSLLQEREEDYKELIDLFQNHPEYPYKLRDLKDICIVRNKRNSKYYDDLVCLLPYKILWSILGNK